MTHLRTKISITAPPERVWHLLTDFVSYPQWNPFIRRVRGELREGAQLEVYLQPSGARGMTFRPRVLKVEPDRELRWLGHFLIPGLFDGEHIFTGFEEMTWALKLQGEGLWVRNLYVKLLTNY